MPDKTPDHFRTHKVQQTVNHIMKAMNEFFSGKPGKNLMESMDQFFSAGTFGGFPVELRENESHYTVMAKLPGVNKEQIDIDVFPQYITLSIQHNEFMEKNDSAKSSYMKQESHKRWSRTIPFIKPVDTSLAAADYENGLLSIKVPKKKGKKMKIK